MKSKIWSLTEQQISELNDEFEQWDSENSLVLIFSNSKAKQATFSKLRQLLPTSHIMGCSTAGQISDVLISDELLSISIIKFEKTHIQCAYAPVKSSLDSFDAGVNVTRQLNGDHLRAIFVLSDGLNVNGSELAKGLNIDTPPEVVVTGGLAGDQDNFAHTWVLKDDKPSSNKIAAIGFYGENFQVAHASCGGWDKFGVMRRVTKSDGNILYSLDNRAALNLYKEYLGDKAKDLPSAALLFPLAVYSDPKDLNNYLVRTILGVDEKNNSMTFAGDIPQDSTVQLMKANFDRLIDGSSESANQLLNSKLVNQGFVIAISCVGRRLVLGERTEEELEVIKEFFPTSDISGFYSYGELSPHTNGSCELHNQTMTLTLLNES